jgi:hypothetical protein
MLRTDNFSTNQSINCDRWRDSPWHDMTEYNWIFKLAVTPDMKVQLCNFTSSIQDMKLKNKETFVSVILGPYKKRLKFKYPVSFCITYTTPPYSKLYDIILAWLPVGTF